MANRKLTILYGSQTGTAQDLAEQIWRESKLYYFNGSIMPMDSYDRRLLITEDTVIFVCSTTGQGDEPDNMKQFWKFLLRKGLPLDSLENLKYAVIGLGDSSYAKFNFVAKRLNKRLEQIGGKRLIDLGLCDDQHDLGPSAVYLSWTKQLWNKLLELYPIPNGYEIRTEYPQFKWNIQIFHNTKPVKPVLTAENIFNKMLLNEHVDELDYNIYKNCNDYIFNKPFPAECISNVRTTSSDHFQDVRLISFDVSDIKWNPGDVLMVRPQNSAEKVNELFAIFKEHNFSFHPYTFVQIEEISPEMPVPEHLLYPLTLETIATQLWDLTAIPRPRAFELLALNCENDLEKEKLLEFATAEGQQELFSYVNRPRRSIIEVLRDFPHSTGKLNLNTLFELFQPIKPRSFSIASPCTKITKNSDDNESNSEILQILVAVVNYKTKLKAPRLGLCSNWLKELTIGDKILGVIKRGTFRLPKICNIPLVMVGPGTGLAPLRCIILYRKIQKIADQKNLVLFFGCRGDQTDFHCKTDLQQMESMGMLTLFTAFSRDQDHKIYVQHKIKEQSELLKDLLINRNGYFLVSGSSKNMPENVKEALCTALNVNYEFIDKMIKDGRYQEETWS